VVIARGYRQLSLEERDSITEMIAEGARLRVIAGAARPLEGSCPLSGAPDYLLVDMDVQPTAEFAARLAHDPYI
jgi:hypothetical protein